MEIRIICSHTRVQASDQSGCKIIFFEDEGRSRYSVFLRHDDSIRDLIQQLENSLPRPTDQVAS